MNFKPTRMHRAHPRHPPWPLPGILSINVCCLGKLTLVLELGHQPFIRDAGDIVAAVVTSIPQDHSATTM